MLWLRKVEVEAGPSPQMDVGGAATGSIGIDQDIVRRETFAMLMDIDAAAEEARAQREAMLERTRSEAARILADARAQAEALLADAGRQYASGFALGQEEGLRQAAVDWHARSAEHYVNQSAVLMRMRERCAQMVAQAFQRIAGTIDRAAVFEQAAREMERLIEAGSPLTVRVCPDDLVVAKARFEACAAGWLERGRPVALAVWADPSLAPGACLCESDLGTLDASLDTQVSVMLAALDKALGALPVDGSLPGDEGEALADDHRDSDSGDAPLGADRVTNMHPRSDRPCESHDDEFADYAEDEWVE